MEVCWNITNRCNRNCKFCFRDKESTELSYEENIKILDYFEKIGVTKITFAGGEPFLYKDIKKILKISKEKNIYTKVTTNGSLINEKNIESYFKYVDRVAFSVDSASEDENYFLGRGVNHYTHIKEIIPVIKKKYPRIKIEINTVITNQTINGIDLLYESILEFFQPHTINKWKLLRFSPLRGTAKEKEKNFAIGNNDFNAIQKKYSSLFAPFPIVIADTKDLFNKTVVTPSGLLETYKNGKSIYKDLRKITQSGKKKSYSVSDNNIDLDINLNSYKDFYNVVQYGSLSLASKKTYVSQPAISKSIKNLEEKLNVTLFNRTINGMNLTEIGEEFYYYVKKAYNNLKMGYRCIIEKSNINNCKLLIGVPSHIASFCIFDIIKKFHIDFPQIKIEIVSRPTVELINQLESHDLDFVIDTSPIEKNNKLHVEKFTKIDHCFVGIKKHNYNAVISNLAELSKYPLILPVSKSSHRKRLNELFNYFNVKVNNVISIETSELIKESILQDLGIGYILKDAVTREINNGILEIIELEEKLPFVSLNIVYMDKYLTETSKLFIEKYLKKNVN